MDLFNKCDDRRIGRGEARQKINGQNNLSQLCSTNWGHLSKFNFPLQAQGATDFTEGSWSRGCKIPGVEAGS
jgi:hypothetical protein